MKSILLSFLPLLLFVAADEFLANHYPEDTATRYALILAIVFGVIQAIYVYIKEKRLDRLLLLDTVLILGMGGISLLSGNDIFFKLKPALIQGVMVIFMAYMAWFKPALLQTMTTRFMPNQDIPEPQQKAMQKSAQGLTVLFFFHTLLIIYAALSLSKAAWAFISGPLLYILAGIFFVFTLVRARLKSS